MAMTPELMKIINDEKINDFLDTQHLGIILATGKEPMNNFQVSNFIGVDPSSTRIKIVKMAGAGLLQKVKNVYILNRKMIVDLIVENYLRYRYNDTEELSPDEIQLIFEYKRRNADLEKNYKHYLSLKESPLTKALVEAYLDQAIKNVVQYKEKTIYGFIRGFEQYAKEAIKKYKIKHKDIDLFLKLFDTTMPMGETLEEITALYKHGIHFTLPTKGDVK